MPDNFVESYTLFEEIKKRTVLQGFSDAEVSDMLIAVNDSSDFKPHFSRWNQFFNTFSSLLLSSHYTEFLFLIFCYKYTGL